MVYPHTFRTEHSETKTTNSMYGEYYTKLQQKKIKIPPELLKILQYVDSYRTEFLQHLEQAVKIPSISGELPFCNDVKKMIGLVEQWLSSLSIKYECFNIGFHEIEGKKLRLPTIILGSLGRDPAKKTVCIYAWIDVNHPDRSKWNTNPWSVTEVDKRLYGSGISGGKGMLLAWFNIIHAFQASNVDIPVNLKFVIESMHYKESIGLESFLALRKQDFFFNVNYVVVCDSEWIGDKYPCLTYGCVGLLRFKVTIEKRPVSETDPKDDMVKIFERIVDGQENILIPKIHDLVQQITPDEESLYGHIRDFDIDEIRDNLPEHKKKWDKSKLLMSFWRLPSIFVHDIEECTCEKDDKSKIKRHFTIKIVPRQMVEKESKSTIDHIQAVCKELNITNKVDVECTSHSRPWIEDIRSSSYQAARKATIQVYKEEPNMIREDRDMKYVTILSRILEQTILVLPMGDRNMNSGGDNESIVKKHYYEGMKLLAAYLFQVSYITD